MRANWLDVHFGLKKKPATTCLQPQKVYSLLMSTSIEYQNLRRLFGKNFAILTTESTFLPYLSLQENLLLLSSIKEKKQRQQLRQWMALVQLKPVLLNKDPIALTPFEKIKCQLIQLSLSKKQLIIVTDIFSELTIAQTQELLPLFQKIARQANKQILLLTSETAIAESLYVDKTLAAIDDLLPPQAI